jgi:hypothetical protein
LQAIPHTLALINAFMHVYIYKHVYRHEQGVCVCVRVRVHATTEADYSQVNISRETYGRAAGSIGGRTFLTCMCIPTLIG